LTEAILELVDRVLITLDAQGNVVDMNRAARRVLDLPPGANDHRDACQLLGRIIDPDLLCDDLPDSDAFREIMCRDISKGGIAFYLDERPDFELVVLDLGRGGAARLFTAKVMHVRHAEVDGEEKYLVGCQFTGRVVGRGEAK